jgi:tetratricopeptide (TPR) repeat protein|tara:strand:- start:2296 stop:2874 length:579 start_codon:yes stop_codon:yes gene_type:complete
MKALFIFIGLIFSFQIHAHDLKKITEKLLSQMKNGTPIEAKSASIYLTEISQFHDDADVNILILKARAAISNPDLSRIEAYETALSFYEEANAIDPDYLYALDRASLMLFLLKFYSEAQLSSMECLAINPNYYPCIYGMAHIYMAMGMKKEALIFFKTALEMFPSNTSINSFITSIQGKIQQEKVQKQRMSL